MAAESQVQKIVGLDIGTNKVAAIVAEVNNDGELEIIGIGTHHSRGLKRVWSLTLNPPCNPFSARWKRLN